MENRMMVSKCCKATLTIGGDTGHGQTAYYVCASCLRPTDACASLSLGDYKTEELQDAEV